MVPISLKTCRQSFVMVYRELYQKIIKLSEFIILHITFIPCDDKRLITSNRNISANKLKGGYAIKRECAFHRHNTIYTAQWWDAINCPRNFPFRSLNLRQNYILYDVFNMTSSLLLSYLPQLYFMRPFNILSWITNIELPKNCDAWIINIFIRLLSRCNNITVYVCLWVLIAQLNIHN